MVKFLSLNCKSLNCKLSEVKLLLYSVKPSIFCFCETWLSRGSEPKFIGYSALWKHRVDGYGGLGMLIHTQHSFRERHLNEFYGGVMEVQAVDIIMESGEGISVLNCYNPGYRVSIEEMRHYLQQLLDKFILLGDLNAHTRILDSKCIKSNYTGKTLETMLVEDCVCINNPQDLYTYVSFSYLKRSCLDVCLSSPEVAPLISVELGRDVGSDHLPIQVNLDINPATQLLKVHKRWLLEGVDWCKWRLCLSEGRITLPDSVDSINNHIIDCILSAAEKNVPQTSGNLRSGKEVHGGVQTLVRKLQRGDGPGEC